MRFAHRHPSRFATNFSSGIRHRAFALCHPATVPMMGSVTEVTLVTKANLLLGKGSFFLSYVAENMEQAPSGVALPTIRNLEAYTPQSGRQAGELPRETLRAPWPLQCSANVVRCL